MKTNALRSAAVAALMTAAFPALASGPSPFTGTPVDYHSGQASCVFAIKGDTPGAFLYYGVTYYNPDFGGQLDPSAISNCNAIQNAFYAKVPLGWGQFPAGQAQTVPCDPNFCVSGTSKFTTAMRITNLVGVPSGL